MKYIIYAENFAGTTTLYLARVIRETNKLFYLDRTDGRYYAFRAQLRKDERYKLFDSENEAQRVFHRYRCVRKDFENAEKEYNTTVDGLLQ